MLFGKRMKIWKTVKGCNLLESKKVYNANCYDQGINFTDFNFTQFSITFYSSDQLSH